MKKYLKLFAAMLMSLFVSQLALAAADTSKMTIVEVAMHDKNLTTLVKAIKAAGLVETLKGTGPYTVFAPTNAAFAKLPKGTLQKLLKDKTQLAAILTYHVVPGKVMAADVNNGPVNTVQGQPVTLNKTAAGVDVNNAKVVKADIVASNGVIHEINAVLMPSNTSTTSQTVTTPATSTTTTTTTTPSNVGATQPTPAQNSGTTGQ